MVSWHLKPEGSPKWVGAEPARFVCVRFAPRASTSQRPPGISPGLRSATGPHGTAYPSIVGAGTGIGRGCARPGGIALENHTKRRCLNLSLSSFSSFESRFRSSSSSGRTDRPERSQTRWLVISRSFRYRSFARFSHTRANSHVKDRLSQGKQHS